MLYAVGSRSHVTFIDPRQPSTLVASSIKSPDKDCGVRSLAFNQQLLSIGTGAGHLYFYDMRAKDFIWSSSSSKPYALTASQGWLVRILMYTNNNNYHYYYRNMIRHIKISSVVCLVHPMPFTHIVIAP